MYRNKSYLTKIAWIGFTLLGIAVLSGGCRLGTDIPRAQPTDVLLTQAAETVDAGIAQTPLPSATATLLPSATPLPASPTTKPSATSQPTQTHTLEPSSVPLPPPLPDFDLVIQDDFSNESIWYVNSGDDFGFNYVDGGYRIYINIPFASIWSLRGKEYSDVRVEVDGAWFAGDTSGYYGVMCRHIDEDNYYALMVSSAGRFGIGKMEEGEWEFLYEAEAQPGVIKSDKNANRITADCIGEALTLYVNGLKLVELDEDDFRSGSVGVIARSQSVTPFEALFDNFSLLVR